MPCNHEVTLIVTGMPSNALMRSKVINRPSEAETCTTIQTCYVARISKASLSGCLS